MPQVIELFTTSAKPTLQKARYDRDYGAKYQRGVDIKDIAKMIRMDIKAAIKTGQLPNAKYSVRIDRYSMGQSIDVSISEVESPKLILNVARVKAEKEHPHDYYAFHHNSGLKQYSEIGNELLQTVSNIVKAYNYDGSDAMVDYFDVNFYSNIAFDWQYEKAVRNLILEHLE